MRNFRLSWRQVLATALPLLVTGTVTAGTIELINRTTIPAAIRSNGGNGGPIATAADGRFLLFRSTSSNLVAGDSNNVSDVFLLDTQTQALERVNLGSNGEQADGYFLGGGGGVSADGRYVLFTSATRSFGATDTHGVTQVYRRDRQSGITTLISVDSGGNAGTSASVAYALSADGRYSLFATSATNLIGPSSFSGVYQLYRHDALTGQHELVSANTNGNSGAGSSHSGTMTPDGRHVLFYSNATDLIANDPNGPGFDLYLRDMSTGAIELASLDLSGVPLDDAFVFMPWVQFGSCSPATLSADGRYAVFSTSQSAGPGGNLHDVYRYDSVSNTTQRISTASGSVSPQRFNQCPSISADGNRVAFESLGDRPAAEILIRDISAGSLVRVDMSPLPLPVPTSMFGSLTLDDDGETLLFATDRLPQAPEQLQIFRSVNAAAPVALVQPLPAPVAYANDDSGDTTRARDRPPGISADERYVVFSSLASNLVVGDNNGVADVFLRDRLYATTQRISLRSDGGESSCASRHASLSADARFVVFSSCGSLVEPASGTQSEVYRLDRSSGALELVSRNRDGLRANNGSADPHLSADGSIIAFSSPATDLVAATGGGSGSQIYVRDMTAAATILVSRTTGGQAGNNYSLIPYVSADGSSIAFSSSASNLVSGDSNNREDAFVARRDGTPVERVSAAASGSVTGGGGTVYGLSADGSQVIFSSSRNDILPDASELYTHTFLRDRNNARTYLIAVPGDPGRRGSTPSISPDGNRITFVSEFASALGPHDTVQFDRIYLYERRTGQYRVITPYLASDYGRITRPQLSPGGDSIGFYSSRGSLADDGNGPIFDVFLALDTADSLFMDGFQP